MDEKTKTIIDRARALLAAATPGPWEVCPDTRPDVRTTCNTGGFLGCGHIATVSRYDANEADAALIAAAPGLLATLCDAMEAAERRAEEAEAQAAATMAVIREIRETCCAALGDGLETIVTTGVVRILRDRLHAAESKVARLETRTAVLCDCVSCCSGHVAPDIEDACPDCHGSGAVIVEGGE